MDDLAPWLQAASQAGTHALPGFAATLTLWLAMAWLAVSALRRSPAAPETGQSNPVLALRLAAGLGAIAGCSALFAAIATQLGTGRALGRLDEAFMAALAAADTPPWALHGFRLLSFLGERSTLTALAVGVALLAWAGRHPRLAWAWSLTLAGNGLLNPGLKQLFERARPVHPSGVVVEEGFSFPSGHSSGAVVAYGMLAYLAVRLLPRRWHAPVVTAAAALAYAVGASRVFLHAHFPSDVLAGFASGLAWLAVCIGTVELGRRRGRRDSTLTASTPSR